MSDAKKGSGKKKLLIILPVVVIALLGTGAAAVFGLGLMGGGESDGHGEAAHGGHGGHGGHAKAGGTSDVLEVDIGEYALTVYQQESGGTLLVSFHLYGTVKHEQSAEFAELFEGHKHRARQHVLVSVRDAEMGDLMDPGLGLIRRQIKHHINSSLGHPMLQEVIFSDFLITER